MSHFCATKEDAIKNLKDAVLLYLEYEIKNQSMQAIINSDKKQEVSHAIFKSKENKRKVVVPIHNKDVQKELCTPSLKTRISDLNNF